MFLYIITYVLNSMNRCSCIESLTYKHTTAATTLTTRLRQSIMETMRRALSQLAKEIEELKFKYIEAERSNNLDRMEDTCFV